MNPQFSDAGIQFFKNLHGMNYLFLFEYQGAIHGQSSISYNCSLDFLNKLYGIGPAVTTAPVSPPLRPTLPSSRSLETRVTTPRANTMATGALRPAPAHTTPVTSARDLSPLSQGLTSGSLVTAIPTLATVTCSPPRFPASSSRVSAHSSAVLASNARRLTTGAGFLATGTQAPAPALCSPVPGTSRDAQASSVPRESTRVHATVMSSGQARVPSVGTYVTTTTSQQQQHSTPTRASNSILRGDRSVEDIFELSVAPDNPQCSPIPHVSHNPTVTIESVVTSTRGHRLQSLTESGFLAPEVLRDNTNVNQWDNSFQGLNSINLISETRPQVVTTTAATSTTSSASTAHLQVAVSAQCIATASQPRIYGVSFDKPESKFQI